MAATTMSSTLGTAPAAVLPLTVAAGQHLPLLHDGGLPHTPATQPSICPPENPSLEFLMLPDGGSSRKALRPKRWSVEEDDAMLRAHVREGNRWGAIAEALPGRMRTQLEVKVSHDQGDNRFSRDESAVMDKSVGGGALW